MKRTIYAVLCIALCMVITPGCNNDSFLNLNNPQAYNPGDVWNDEKLANAYLVDLYSSLPGWPTDQSNYSDEGAGILAEGAVDPNGSGFKYWPYSVIRKINILLQDINGGSLPADKVETIKGQAWFLRAFHYFRAVTYHGGVPIIRVPQLLTDSLNVARNSTKECFDFILQDLDSAIQALPDRYTGNDFGRIDKAAAMAFRGRVLLYEASPQFNPANPYTNSYWPEAYAANKSAREFLEGLGFGLYPDYGGIWMEEQNQEDVMTVVYMNPGKLNGRQEHCVRPLTQSKDCTGSDNPSWNLVASYPMADGKPPGTSAKYAYDLQTFWKNRDPRFAATIAYNGAVFPLGVSADRRQYTDIQVGGLDDGFGPGEHYNRTGFYCRKGIDNSLSQAQVGLNAVDWVEIRFAEVLLNFAEAANETGHPDEALAVLKQIRQRAGIEAGGDNMYGLASGMSTSDLREAIYLERQIEFAFEGKRFMDLRRTRRLGELNGETKYGLLAQLKPGLDPTDHTQTYLPEDFTYSVSELFVSGPKKMYTPDSYYFFPISETEMQKDPALEQNKDWGGSFDPTLH